MCIKKEGFLDACAKRVLNALKQRLRNASWQHGQGQSHVELHTMQWVCAHNVTLLMWSMYGMGMERNVEGTRVTESELFCLKA